MFVAAKPSGYSSPQEAGKQLQTYAMENFTLPGEPGFPLNSLYAAPASRLDAGQSALFASLLGGIDLVGLLGR